MPGGIQAESTTKAWPERNMLKKDAKKIVGGLTRTEKMPGFSYSLPAWECQTGNKLSEIEGTPCFDCYAKKIIILDIQQLKKRNIAG